MRASGLHSENELPGGHVRKLWPVRPKDEKSGFGACRSDADRLKGRVPWKRKLGGGVLAAVGYLLSPLSWWNDLFVNIPLALVFAWVVSAFYKPAFSAALVVGYWLTNVLGFVLLHKGAQQLFTDQPKRYAARELAKDVVISVAYTLLIVALVKFGVLKPFEYYFPGASPTKAA